MSTMSKSASGELELFKMQGKYPKVLSGKAVVSNNQVTNVKFPVGFFNTVPNVVATAQGPSDANVTVVYNSVSTEGFGLSYNHTSDLYVCWIAVEN